MVLVVTCCHGGVVGKAHKVALAVAARLGQFVGFAVEGDGLGVALIVAVKQAQVVETVGHEQGVAACGGPVHGLAGIEKGGVFFRFVAVEFAGEAYGGFYFFAEVFGIGQTEAETVGGGQGRKLKAE